MARVALAGLLLMCVAPQGAMADPLVEVRTSDEEGGNCCTTWVEHCMDASVQGVVDDQEIVCVNRDVLAFDTVDLNPLVTPREVAVGPETVTGLLGQVEPDVRTRRYLLLEGVAVPSADVVPVGSVTVLRGEMPEGKNCLHLVEGVPGTPAGPMHTTCLRDLPEPLFWPIGLGELTVHPQAAGPLVDEANPARSLRVDVAVEVTYDCAQMEDTMASFGDPAEGTYRPFHLPYRPFAAEGLGALLHPEATPAVVEVRVVDDAGEVAESRTVVPGAGQAIAYAMYQQERLDGGSDLCA